MGLVDRVKALLGISAYDPPMSAALLTLDDPAVKSVRRAMGGQLQPIPISQPRWYLEDIEGAEHSAD